MDSAIYFPIQRAKAGEIEANSQLAPITHALTRPMLDFPVQRPDDKRSLSFYSGAKIHEIAASLGTMHETYLDFSRYEPDTKLPNKQHVVDHVFQISRQLHLKALPVVAPLSLLGHGTEYFEAVSRVITRDMRGVAIRLPYEDFTTEARLERVVLETASLVSVTPSDVDLYLDAGSLAFVPPEARDVLALAKTVQTAALAADNLGCRRVIFAASSVPGSTMHHAKGERLNVPRIEFQVWRHLVRDPKLSFLRYGDYGVIDPKQTEKGIPRRPPSRVRVTTEDEYVLYKGNPEGIRAISKKVIDDGVLNGLPDFWGMHAVRALKDTAMKVTQRIGWHATRICTSRIQLLRSFDMHRSEQAFYPRSQLLQRELLGCRIR